MPRSFIRSSTRLYRIFIFIFITIYGLFHLSLNYELTGSLNTEDNSLEENTCIIYARQLTHNLTTVNGWETSNYLNSFRSSIRHNTTQYWNENDRFRKFNFTGVKACSIIYCGANIIGTDGLHFAKEYPSCHIWFFEPVPVFYEQFVHSPGWKRLMGSIASRLYHAYAYGLSNRSAFIDIAENSIAEGQSFSLIRKQKMIRSHERHKLIIRDVSEIIFELKILKQVGVHSNTVDGELTLLHMNCEGCEYDVLERLIDTDLIEYVHYLQFGTHRPISIQSTIVERYCALQKKLNETHKRDFGIPWGWERWTLHE
jgi:FkbM family methyltransferase